MPDTTKPSRAACVEMQKAYDFFNCALFGGKLPPCRISYQCEKRKLGYYAVERQGHGLGSVADEIVMQPGDVSTCSVTEFLSCLVHEMAHHWQRHFGTPGRGRYHNRQWADLMESSGLMPSHSGQPGGRRTGDRMHHYIIKDGAYAAAVKELLASGFTLTSHDRFSATQGGEREGISGIQYACPECSLDDWANAAPACRQCMSDVAQQLCEGDAVDEAELQEMVAFAGRLQQAITAIAADEQDGHGRPC